MRLNPLLSNPVFVAIDTTDLDAAKALAARLHGAIGGIKLGLEFFGAHGAKGVAEVTAGSGLPLFLDLKFHDIPNTVAGALRAVAPLRPAITNVHAQGGAQMMKAAAEANAEAAAKLGFARPLLIAVTVLTSLDAAGLNEAGVPGEVLDHVRRLAALARRCGLDGVVCSPKETAVLRQDNGPDFRLVTPGIRPAWAGADDQKRITTPAQAMADGADVLVIGRPITAAPDPAAAARRVLEELKG
ncbi:MAG: orotidine 5'-phosphate decarboxylase [Alphaproteobacteria bacterium RIFOXYD12_FULL_60_8]|nr:MAG: orotidine 5'-phosphate decarboxylase [Alphaproteobacteria bacterium RIFOXYD12_FULL_60_8]